MFLHADEIAIEMAITFKECMRRIQEKKAKEQLGLLWVDLPGYVASPMPTRPARQSDDWRTRG